MAAHLIAWRVVFVAYARLGGRCSLVQGADTPPPLVGKEKPGRAPSLASVEKGKAGIGFGRWQAKTSLRQSEAAAEPEDTFTPSQQERSTSTALPVGFAVDLEEELAKAKLEGSLDDGADDDQAGAASPSSSPPPVAGGGGGGGDVPPLTAGTTSSSWPSKKKLTLEDFEVLRVIGKGSFGKVFLVQRKDKAATPGSVFAMKVLKKDHVRKRRQIEHTRTERKVLGTVRHPFIVGLHYAFQTEEKLYFVLDYCPGGELFFWLSREKRLPEHMARFYTSEITLALAHLHAQQVVYRDLKPENILLDQDGHVKLADFGLAKEGIDNSTSGAFSLCGTPEYLAPEILLKKGHGLASDWWNMGMVLFEMLTGLPPWYTTDRQLLFDRLKSAPLVFPDHISPVAQQFIAALLVRDPAKRLGKDGGEEVKAHPFFVGIDWTLLRDKRYQPPFNPCRDQDIVSADNFESEFRDLEISPSEDLGAAEPDASGGYRQGRVDSDTFAGFSFQPESVVSGRLHALGGK